MTASPAAAIAWELGRRHRWGWIIVAGYISFLAASRFVVTSGGGPVFSTAPSFAFGIVVPLTVMFLYFLAVFSFGISGDFAARQSTYPARMFTLPASTAALAGWPMLYGCLAAMLLWLATRFLGVWPADAQVPVWWPLLLGPALLAWTQALTWMPYPLAGMRVAAAVLWLAIINAVALLALELHAPEPVMLALLAPHVPLAFVVAHGAVKRARRGDVPDWGGAIARIASALDIRWRSKTFRSPLRAQEWLEWRQHGRALPAMVAIVLPCELALLYLFPDTPGIVLGTLIGVLVTPPFMATFVAATVSRGDAQGFSPFAATRPLGSADLIRAKLVVTFASAVCAWLLVLAATPVAVKLSGAQPVVSYVFGRIFEIFGLARGSALLLLIVAAMAVSTWKALVQSLCIGMTGRTSFIKASTFASLFALAAAGPILDWIVSSEGVRLALWKALPWILGILVVAKAAASAWAIAGLHRNALVCERTFLRAACVWCVLVAIVFGVMTSLFPAFVVSRYLLACVAILGVPFFRLAAAPLALAWNRHGSLTRERAAVPARVLAAVVLLFVPVLTALAMGTVSYARDRDNGLIVSSGQKREYLVHVPHTYDGRSEVPLVISMHGAGGWPAQQMRLTGWNRVADREGFIVVYPSALERGSPRKWGVPVDGQRERDVQFIADLIDVLRTEFRIDSERIYADGLSNGGSMAYLLSCTLSDRIAAVGMVAAAQTVPWRWCSDTRAVPMISFHGTGDKTVPYGGGKSVPGRWRFPAVETWTASWARRNGCVAAPRETAVAHDVTRREYAGCANDASVVLYSVRGGGHTWPGSEPMPEWFVGRTAASIEATEEMWGFFAKHPLITSSAPRYPHGAAPR